jgi:hypothetical protein
MSSATTVPDNMFAAEKTLKELSEVAIREAEAWDWSFPGWQVS